MPAKSETESSPETVIEVTEERELLDKNQIQTNNEKVKADGPQSRWIVVVLVMCYFVADGFSKTCFGQVDNIVADFFQVSLKKVDLLTVAPSVSSAFALSVMTWKTASGVVGLRIWCLASSGFLIVSFASIVASMMSRNLFLLAIVGQVFAGIANAINFSLAPLLASSWFPDKEAPTLIALTYVGLNIGNIIGFVAPTQMFPKRSGFLSSPDFYLSENVVVVLEEEEWADHVTTASAAIFSSFLSASVIIGFVSFLFILDAPTPLQLPAQSNLENDQSDVIEASEGDARKKLRLSKRNSSLHFRMTRLRSATRGTIASWFRLSRSLLTDKKFLVLAIPYAIILPLCFMWFALMSDVLRSISFNNVIFTDVNNLTPASMSDSFIITSNMAAGYVMVMYCVGGSIGGILTGQIAKLFKFNYTSIACGTSWAIVASSVGITLGFKFSSMLTLFVCNFLFGFFVSIAITSLVTLVIEFVTNVEKLTVATWLTILSSVTAALMPLIGRLLFEQFGPLSLGLFQIILASLVAIFLPFVKKFLR